MNSKYDADCTVHCCRYTSRFVNISCIDENTNVQGIAATDLSQGDMLDFIFLLFVSEVENKRMLKLIRILPELL